MEYIRKKNLRFLHLDNIGKRCSQVNKKDACHGAGKIDKRTLVKYRSGGLGYSITHSLRE